LASLAGLAAGATGGWQSGAARAETFDAVAMLGWIDPDTATLWLQAAAPAEAICSVSPVRYAHARPPTAQPDRTTLTAADGFTAAFRVADLEPDVVYRWTLILREPEDARGLRSGDGEARLEGQFRTPAAWSPGDSPAPVVLAFGSCHYLNDGRFDRPGPPYGADYEIFEAIRAQRPDAMLWLGDNVYLREPEWNDAALAAARYRAHRAQPAVARLWAEVPHVGVWDDHDFGPNDADGSFANKAMTRALFRRHWPDAGRGAEALPETIASRLRIADVEVFLLDDRWYRTSERAPDAPGKALLGPAQLAWLQAGLLASDANLKVVAMGTQFFNRASRFESWAHYRDEQQAWLDFLAESRVPGVVFLSGDRHFGELLRIERPGLYPLYECTSSPLTANFVPSAVLDAAERDNPDLVPGTLVNRRHFSVLRVSGSPDARRLAFEARATDGTLLWAREIALSALTPPVSAAR
jgi:alkaline phosphatase D